MTKMIVFVCAIAAMCFAGTASAIDGGAATIDTLGVEGTSFNHAGSVAGTFGTEVAVTVPTDDWAILAGVSYRSADPDWSNEKLEGWGGDLGIKYYFTRLTSLALLGGMEQYDALASKNVTTASLAFKQRLLPARAGVSPFVDAGFGLRFPDYVPTDPADHSNHDYVIKLGAGCDFMFTDTLALMFGVNYNTILESLNLSNMSKNDGWTGTLAIVGYWD